MGFRHLPQLSIRYRDRGIIMDNKGFAKQFNLSAIKHGFSECGVDGLSLLQKGYNAIKLDYESKAAQHIEQLLSCMKDNSPIEEAMLYALIVVAQSSVELVRYRAGNYEFGDHGDHLCGPDLLIIEPQAQIENYRADFLLTYKSLNNNSVTERRLVVECDGHDFHEKTKHQASNDKRRDREMQKLGYEVFRFTGSDIWKDVFSLAQEAIEMVTGLTESKIRIKHKQNRSSILDDNKSATTITESLERYIGLVEQRLSGDVNAISVKTGFESLDEKIGGLNRSDLIVIASRPSIGKTALSLGLLGNIAKTNQKPAMLISLSDTEDLLVSRLVASESSVVLDRVTSAEMPEQDWDKIAPAIARIKDWNALIDCNCDKELSSIISEVKSASKSSGGLSAVFIDYMQLIHVDGVYTGNSRSSEITRALKDLAKQIKTPVVLLSQIGKTADQRADKRPSLHDFAGMESVEQDADLILFIYRDDFYHDDTIDKGIAEIIIGKQRNGPLGTVRLTFQGEYSRFCNYAGPSMREDY